MTSLHRTIIILGICSLLFSNLINITESHSTSSTLIGAPWSGNMHPQNGFPPSCDITRQNSCTPSYAEPVSYGLARAAMQPLIHVVAAGGAPQVKAGSAVTCRARRPAAAPKSAAGARRAACVHDASAAGCIAYSMLNFAPPFAACFADFLPVGSCCSTGLSAFARSAAAPTPQLCIHSLLAHLWRLLAGRRLRLR